MISHSHHQSNKAMKESKQTKTLEGEDGVDMISKLPDHVLQSILSCLEGTEEVIRTSILSTRWRHLWTSIPSIDIDYTRILNPSMELDSKGFKEFVYWVLLNKPQLLESFRLWCADYYTMSTVNRWIHAAVMRKVKLLDLMFCPREESEDVELPHCLITCESLEVLRLCFLQSGMCLPKITGFSALRVLEMHDVSINEANVVSYFLESCPLLEDLSLIRCNAWNLVISSQKLKNLRIEKRERIYHVATEEFIDHRVGLTIEISCPKLEFLNLTGPLSYDFSIENLFSLKKAVIHIKDFHDSQHTTLDLFGEISHVEDLSISLYCVGKWYDSRSLCDEPLSLPNLKTLEIIVDAMHMHMLIPFLKCFPDLESLHLIFIKHVDGLDMLILEDAETIKILTRFLKKVEFLEFDEEEPNLVVACALLKYGNLLEKMVFSWSDKVKFHERGMKIMKIVSKFRKAYSNAKLIGVYNPTLDN